MPGSSAKLIRRIELAGFSADPDWAGLNQNPGSTHGAIFSGIDNGVEIYAVIVDASGRRLGSSRDINGNVVTNRISSDGKEDIKNLATTDTLNTVDLFIEDGLRETAQVWYRITSLGAEPGDWPATATHIEIWGEAV